MHAFRPRSVLFLSGLALSIGLTLTPLTTQAGSSHDLPANAAEQAVNARAAATARTQELLDLHRRWQGAPAQDKESLRQLLLAQAEQRRQLLRELAQSNPAEVLRVAIPADRQAKLPAEVQALLEEHVELQGELEVVYFDDFETPANSHIEHGLKTAFSEHFRLHEAQHSKGELQSGQRVSVKGLVIPSREGEGADDGELVVGSFDENILALGADSSTSYGSQPGVQPNTVGEQRTLVMMVNFQDAPTSKPWTSTDMQALFSDQVSPFYREVSFGQTWFTATVADWQTIATNSTSCDRNAITQLADEAAIAAGHVLADYDRLVYVFPKTTSCGWAGLGTIGGKPSRAWINGKFDTYTYTHELGHNLGLYHSHDLECGNVTLGSDCSVTEYGDNADTMGVGRGHFNAYQKDRLGWFGNRILAVANSGSYRLSPYEFEGAQPLALKTLKSVDPSNGARTWYYLEYRQAIGVDSGINASSTSNLDKGLSIHNGVDLNGKTSYLLDMTPDTTDWYDAALVSGASYYDPEAGINITTQWADSQEAVVDIGLGSPQCVQSNPSVSLTAGSSNWAYAGGVVSYTLSVVNRDTSNCSSRSFSLSSQVPPGWSGSLSANSLSLAPGASATATLSVTSSSSAVAGFYDISANAANGSNSTTASASYVVEAPTTTNNLPVARDDNANTNESTEVTIAVLANDSDADGDTLSVTSTSGGSGTVRLNSNGTVSFTPASGFSGTTSFIYSISDGKDGSANAQVSVNVSTNQAPVASNDTATMTSVGSVKIAVLSNDWDPEGSPLQVVGFTQGSKGSVSLNSDGTLTYSPAKGFKSSDSFTYTISDGSKTASASVQVSLATSSGAGGGGKGR